MNAVVVQMMTTEEARACVIAINNGLAEVRYQLLELYEREGWRALGYDSWRECAVSEFRFSKTRVYELLSAAETERNLSEFSAMAENSAPIPERTLRPLTQLEPEEQPVVWERAVTTAPNGKVTAKHVEKVVNEYHTLVNDAVRDYKAAAANHGNSGEYDGDEWYTPGEYLEAAHHVMGGIDCVLMRTDVLLIGLTADTVL